MPGEKITAVIPIDYYRDQDYLIMATKKGLVKKTSLREYMNVRKTGLAAITLRDEDSQTTIRKSFLQRSMVSVSALMKPT